MKDRKVESIIGDLITILTILQGWGKSKESLLFSTEEHFIQ